MWHMIVKMKSFRRKMAAYMALPWVHYIQCIMQKSGGEETQPCILCNTRNTKCNTNLKNHQKNNIKTKMHKSGGEKTQPCILCNTRSFCPTFKPQLIVCLRCFSIVWDLYNTKYDFLGVIYCNTCVRYIVNCYVFFLVKRKSLKEFEFQLCSCVW